MLCIIFWNACTVWYRCRFRLGIGGAQAYYNITPDLTTLGKIVGGGMPIGAYGGKREIFCMCI